MNNGVLVKRIRQALKQENVSTSKIDSVVSHVLGQTRVTTIPKAVFEKAFKNAFTRLNQTNKPIILMRTRTNKVRVFSQEGLEVLRQNGHKRIPHLKPFPKKSARRFWTQDQRDMFIADYQDFQSRKIPGTLLEAKYGRTMHNLHSAAWRLGIARPRK